MGEQTLDEIALLLPRWLAGDLCCRAGMVAYPEWPCPWHEGFDRSRPRAVPVPLRFPRV